MFRRFETLHMTVTNDVIAFEAGQSGSPVMLVSKEDGKVTIEKTFARPQGCIRKSVHGILGIAELPLGRVVIVATQKVRLGDCVIKILFYLSNSQG